MGRPGFAAGVTLLVLIVKIGELFVNDGPPSSWTVIHIIVLAVLAVMFLFSSPPPPGPPSAITLGLNRRDDGGSNRSGA